MEMLSGWPVALTFASVRLIVSAWALALGVCAWPASADTSYPTKPITFIVPWGSGGGSDMSAREIARLATDQLKVPMPVINMPGATGTVGMSKLVGAPADGYTGGWVHHWSKARRAGSTHPNRFSSSSVRVT